MPAMYWSSSEILLYKEYLGDNAWRFCEAPTFMYFTFHTHTGINTCLYMIYPYICMFLSFVKVDIPKYKKQNQTIFMPSQRWVKKFNIVNLLFTRWTKSQGELLIFKVSGTRIWCSKEQVLPQYLSCSHLTWNQQQASLLELGVVVWISLHEMETSLHSCCVRGTHHCRTSVPSRWFKLQLLIFVIGFIILIKKGNH